MMEWIKELLTAFWEYLKPWVLVNDYEEALILRKGRYVKTLESGLYFKIPFIDYAMHVYTKTDTKEFEPISITTADGKTISIGLMIEYIITDCRTYMLDNNDSPSNMRDIARAEMSDLLEDINWIDIKKKTTKNALRRVVAERYKSLGVELTDLKFTNKCESRVYRLISDKEKNLNAI